MLSVLRLLAILAFTYASTSVANEEKNTQFGVGIGLRYVGLGVSGEYLFNDKYGVSLGLGKNAVDTSFVLGGNYYIPRSSYSLMLSAYYGAVTAVTCSGCFDDRYDDSFMGIAIGGGIKLKMGNEFSIFYIKSSGMDDRINKLESLGYSSKSGNPNIRISFGIVF